MSVTGVCGCAAEAAEGGGTAHLAHLYQCLGLSMRQISAKTGVDRQQVVRLLRQAGVQVAPRGVGRGRPGRRRADPPDLGVRLHQMYIEQRMSSTAIGELLGIDARRVRQLLHEQGIPMRGRGTHRSTRRQLRAEDLQTWYVEAQLPAAEVGSLLGASLGIVLRQAHDQGVSVRVGGPPSSAGPAEIELIDALYADDLVARALARHKVPIRAAAGQLWERFPTPVLLTRALVADLYEECGVSAHHIELLTGVPVPTVTRKLHAVGVELRPAGGRCPFLRRWRRGRSGPAGALDAVRGNGLGSA